MVENGSLFGNFVSQRVREAGLTACNSPEGAILSHNMNKSFSALDAVLSEEQQDLLVQIDDFTGSLTSLKMTYCYLQGLKDAMAGLGNA